MSCLRSWGADPIASFQSSPMRSSRPQSLKLLHGILPAQAAFGKFSSQASTVLAANEACIPHKVGKALQCQSESRKRGASCRDWHDAAMFTTAAENQLAILAWRFNQHSEA